jgi:hypothetical protein
VFGGAATAASHDTRAGTDVGLDHAGQFLGRTGEGRDAAFEHRHAGIGLDRQGKGRARSHVFDDGKNLGGSGGAVGADGIRPESGPFVFLKGHVRHHRTVEHLAHRHQGGFDLADIREGLEHEKVGVSLQQGPRLAPEACQGLVEVKIADGRDKPAGRADGRSDERLAAALLPRQPDGRDVDLLGALVQRELGKLQG